MNYGHAQRDLDALTRLTAHLSRFCGNSTD